MRTVYLIGVPGAGKSTLMEAATAGRGEPLDVARPFAHRVYADGAIELGKRRDGFAGTDALGMGVMPIALDWMDGVGAPVVFGEGDRLASDKFFETARARGPLTVVFLDARPDLAAARRAERGSHQKEAWLKGRATKVQRLAGTYATVRLDASRPVADLAPWLTDLIWPTPGRNPSARPPVGGSDS